MSSNVSLEYLNQRLSGLTVTSPTTTAVSAQNSAGTSVLVLLGGTPVPLPTRSYNNGFTVSGDNQTFTVQTAGSYLVEYQINITVGLALSAGVFRNGSAIAALIRSPGVVGTFFSSSAIVTLAAGDALRLVLYGLAGTAVLQSGVGAYLNLIRIA